MDVLRGCLNIAVFLINAITVSSIYDLVLLRTLAQETCGYFYIYAAIRRFIIQIHELCLID